MKKDEGKEEPSHLGAQVKFQAQVRSSWALMPTSTGKGRGHRALEGSSCCTE